MNHYRLTTGELMSVVLLAVVGLASVIPSQASERVCELITEAEASGAVGASVQPGTASASESGDHLCRYVSGRTGMLAITLAEDHGREKYAQAKAKIQGDPSLAQESISGLGDEAVFANISRGISELLVLKGDKSIGIALSGRAANSSKEVLTQLAQKALSRL